MEESVLNLEHCNKMTAGSIVLEGCSSSQSLNLEYCDKISDAGLGLIVEGGSSLQYLNLGGLL